MGVVMAAMLPKQIWLQPLGIYILMSYIKVKLMYDHLCASLSIIPLSHMRKYRPPFNSIPPGQYEHDGFMHSLYLFAKRLAKHKISKEPLMYNLQIFKHLTCYTDSE
jgi:hypothetical protein